METVPAWLAAGDLRRDGRVMMYGNREDSAE